MAPRRDLDWPSGVWEGAGRGGRAARGVLTRSRRRPSCSWRRRQRSASQAPWLAPASGRSLAPAPSPQQRPGSAQRRRPRCLLPSAPTQQSPRAPAPAPPPCTRPGALPHRASGGGARRCARVRAACVPAFVRVAGRPQLDRGGSSFLVGGSWRRCGACWEGESCAQASAPPPVGSARAEPRACASVRACVRCGTREWAARGAGVSTASFFRLHWEVAEALWVSWGPRPRPHPCGPTVGVLSPAPWLLQLSCCPRLTEEDTKGQKSPIICPKPLGKNWNQIQQLAENS